MKQIQYQNWFIIAVLAISSASSHAERAETAEIEQGKVSSDPVTKEQQTKSSGIFGTSTREFRTSARYDLSLAATTTSTWIPFKYGARGQFNVNPSYSIDAEYLTGSLGFSMKGITLLSFTETLLSSTLRIFGDSNSFHWIVGAGYRYYKFYLGEAMLSQITETASGANLSLVKVSSTILKLGFGNQWKYGHKYGFGVDWFTASLAIGTGKTESIFLDMVGRSSSDGKLLTTVTGILEDSPTFSLLKIYGSYSF